MKTRYFLFSDDEESYLGEIEGKFDSTFRTGYFERCSLFQSKEGAKNFLADNFEYIGRYKIYSCTISDMKLED